MKKGLGLGALAFTTLIGTLVERLLKPIFAPFFESIFPNDSIIGWVIFCLILVLVGLIYWCIEYLQEKKKGQRKKFKVSKRVDMRDFSSEKAPWEK